jgi:hypothetical protein
MEAIVMLRKYKQLFIGILIGILIAAVPVGAAVQEYTLKQSECKIVVDGKEVKGELPLLIMDPGFNYIPAAEFRSICDKMGIGFEFDSPTKEIRIDTAQVKAEPTPVPEIIPNEKGEPEEMEVPINKYGLPDFSNYTGTEPVLESDGTKRFFVYEGKEYIFLPGIPDLPFKLPDPYRFECPIINGKVSFIVQLVKRGGGETQVIINEVPYALYKGKRDFCIQYDYYQNTILPLIEGAN